MVAMIVRYLFMDVLAPIASPRGQTVRCAVQDLKLINEKDYLMYMIWDEYTRVFACNVWICLTIRFLFLYD